MNSGRCRLNFDFYPLASGLIAILYKLEKYMTNPHICAIDLLLRDLAPKSNARSIFLACSPEAHYELAIW